jgi:TPP-dependent 2-oxoacid decarboxylase
MAFPADVANQPVLSNATPLDPPTSDPESLEEAVSAIIEGISVAKPPAFCQESWPIVRACKMLYRRSWMLPAFASPLC